MLQEILVWIIFALAAGWLGYKFFWPKKKSDSVGCAAGCSGCSTTKIDVDQIEKELRQRKEFV